MNKMRYNRLNKLLQKYVGCVGRCVLKFLYGAQLWIGLHCVFNASPQDGCRTLRSPTRIPAPCTHFFASDKNSDSFSSIVLGARYAPRSGVPPTVPRTG